MTDSRFNLASIDLMERICDVSIWIFVVELAIRFAIEGKNFFTGRNKYWNYFDTIVIGLSLIASIGTFASFRIFRIFRVFRQLNVIRVIRSASKLKTIVAAIFSALPGIMWTSILFFIVMYTYALVGCAFYGNAFPDLFGNVWKALFSLFQIMTLENWAGGIARPVMDQFPSAWIYFVSYVLVGSYLILNLIVALVISSLQEVEARNAQRELERRRRAGDISKIDEEIDKLHKQMEVVMKLLEESKKI
ncbi:MAG: ion transporter [Bacteroides sp.]|nr:ion transporter [Bacteroides sp.]